MASTVIDKDLHKCRICGHEWESKVPRPKACPACKHYDWEATAWRTEKDTTPRNTTKEGEKDEQILLKKRPNLQKKLGKLNRVYNRLNPNQSE